MGMGGQEAGLLALGAGLLALVIGVCLLIWVVRVRGRKRLVKEDALNQAKARRLGGRQLRLPQDPRS